MRKADSGKQLTLEYTTSMAGYSPVTQTSDPIIVTVDGPLIKAPRISITGTLKVGRTLILKTSGSWPHGTKVAVAWTAAANGLPTFMGFGTESVKIPAATRGKRITVTLTARLAGRAVTDVEYTTAAKVR